MLRYAMILSIRIEVFSAVFLCANNLETHCFLCDNNVILLTAYGRMPTDKHIRHYHQTNSLIQAQS